MRVTTEGLEELNSYEPSPEVYWNDNVGAWDDQLGHFSYDGGATWGAARSYAAAPAPVSTAGAMESLGNTYSLSGPAFDDFNIGTLTPEPDIPVWDEATQGYRDKWGNFSYDGGVTWGAPRYYAPPPVSTAGALAQLPEGPTDRASFIDYEGANAGNPFDAPGFESPWMPPAMQDDGDGGGLWGGFKNALGNIAEVGTVPYQLANEVADRLTGSTEQERWESNVSGNQFADLVTGGRADLEDLPYGLGYATDAALAPATWLTAGVGPSVPVLGSTFSGNVGKRLAGEIVVGAAGIKGSELGAEYAPEVIPNFSVPNIDAEILGRDVLLGDEALNFLGSDAGQSVAGGILGGLAGGVGAYGGLKGLDAALPKAANYGDDVLRGSMLDMADMTGLGPGRMVEPEDAGMVFKGAVDPDDIAFGSYPTAASTGMRALDAGPSATAPLRDLTDADLKKMTYGLSDQMAQAEDAAVRIARDGGDATAQWKVLDDLNEQFQNVSDEVGRRANQVRTFRDIIDNETGEVDLGAFINAGSVARKRILDSLADRATREGRPTGGIYDDILPTEKVSTGLMRQYEGKTGTAGLQLQRDLDNGNRSLKDANIGRFNGRNLQVEPKRVNGKVDPNDEVVQLFKALHGEGEPPPRLRTIYNDLKRMVAEETDDTLKANKDFVLKDDYFYRGWRAPKETRAGVGKGQVGAKPGYQKPRVDATFSELIAEGWEPLSWNPYDMAALRRFAGVQFREQKNLVDALKQTGLAVPVEGATPVGWRVPRVGPAFEGKPYAFIPETAGLADQVGAKTAYTKQFAVPDKLANEIENIFGRTPDMGAILNTVAGAGQKAKQLKLVASLFQQVDFTTRQTAAGFAGAIDSLIAGEPLTAVKRLISLPADFAKIPLSNVSGVRQRQIRDMVLDPKPLFKERPGVSLRSISSAGWSTSDITVVNRSIRQSLDEMLSDPQGLKKAAGMVAGDGKITGAPARRLKALNEASQRGLFEGVYPQAQVTALKKFIVPRIMRQHPDWTDAQISGAAANEVNKMFSTLGSYQQTVKNPVSRKLLGALIFSTNETESLLKQAASTVAGPNKLLWTEYYVGAFVALAAMANIINYAATGEMLDPGQYSPVKGDKYSPIGIGYNSGFMAPEVPFLKGRNNMPVSVDLMGQLDTVFRMLDPQGFIEARENVLPRAALSQLEGEDFFGRPLKGPKERIGQAVSDIFEPIGASQIRGALNIGPDNEGRIGDTGQAIQATGFNLRGEPTATMKDRFAKERFNGLAWEELSPTQRDTLLRENEPFRKELEARRDEAVANGSDSAARQLERANVITELTGQQAALDDRLKSGEVSFEQWHDRTEAIKTEYRLRNDQIWAGVEFKPGKDTILNGFYDAMDKAERADGSMDWDKVDAYRATLSEADNQHIDENTGLIRIRTDQTEKASKYADVIEETGYWKVPDKIFAKWVAAKGHEEEAAGKTPDQFFQEARLAVYQRLLEEGNDEYKANVLTEIAIDKYRSSFDELASEVRKRMREASPELMRALVESGYYQPGVEAAREMFKP